jgi:hypothetical protein
MNPILSWIYFPTLQFSALDMSDQKFKICAFLLYEFKLGSSAAAAA